jgi:hypothetical protein
MSYHSPREAFRFAEGWNYMKAFEFKAAINSDGTLTVPPKIAAHLEKDQAVRVIMLVPEEDEMREWAKLTTDQFLKGYAESDAIYDEL